MTDEWLQCGLYLANTRRYHCYTDRLNGFIAFSETVTVVFSGTLSRFVYLNVQQVETIRV